MIEQNPYEAPERLEWESSTASGHFVPAPLGYRALAFAIDGTLFGAMLLPLFMGLVVSIARSLGPGDPLADSRPDPFLLPVEIGLLITGVLFVFLLIVNLRTMMTGQTLGKWLLGLQIATPDGRMAVVARIFLLRYLASVVILLTATFLGGQLSPYLIGVVWWGLVALNFLPAMGSQRRCLWDYLAGTIVINRTRVR